MMRFLLVILFAIFLSSISLSACDKQDDNETDKATNTIQNTTPASAKPAETAPPAHDPEHPPIDCPLRKQGIDPHGMKPFDDVEKYIAFLEREDRAGWQKPDAVVKALGLKSNETVADLGAGSGYFSFRFAKVLSQGKVVALDIEPEMIRHIHHKAMTEGIDNIEAKLAKPEDPDIPAAADWVFICDVLHHVQNRPGWLKKMHGQMKPGARVALIEFKEGDLPEGPPESLKIPKSKMIDLMAGAGFKLVEQKPELLPYQHFLVFRKG